MSKNKHYTEAHAKLWAWREGAESYFPTPTEVASAKYTFTEIAEALQVDLNANNPDHKVNPDREPSKLLHELYDTYAMAVTTLGKEHKYATRDKVWPVITDGKHRVSEIAGNVGNALRLLESGHVHWKGYIERAIVVLSLSTEFDPIEAVDYFTDKIDKRYKEVENGKSKPRKRSRVRAKSKPDAETPVSESTATS